MRTRSIFCHHRVVAAPRRRLVCFPFAGGSARIYRDWRDALPSDIDVCPVQLAGRETRLREPLPASIADVVEEVFATLSTMPEAPLVLFGQSLGALIAYELACAFEVRGSTVSHLVVSAARAPTTSSGREVIHDLPHADFVREVRELGGTPDEVWREPELVDLVLPILRADFRLAETYVHVHPRRLRCPVTAFGGRDDPWVAPDQLRAWGDTTSAEVDCHFHPGGHFFLNEHPEAVFALLRRILA